MSQDKDKLPSAAVQADGNGFIDFSGGQASSYNGCAVSARGNGRVIMDRASVYGSVSVQDNAKISARNALVNCGVPNNILKDADVAASKGGAAAGRVVIRRWAQKLSDPSQIDAVMSIAERLFRTLTPG